MNEEPTDKVEVLAGENTPLKKTRKSPTYTPEQLEKKRQSIKRASAVRNTTSKSYIEEIKNLKEQVNAIPEVVDVPEPVPEPVVRRVQKKRVKRVQKIYEKYEDEFDDDDDDDDIIEKVIIRRRPKKQPLNQEIVAPQPLNQKELINETYKEKLQKQLSDERLKQVMASLFDC